LLTRYVLFIFLVVVLLSGQVSVHRISETAVALPTSVLYHCLGSTVVCIYLIPNNLRLIIYNVITYFMIYKLRSQRKQYKN